MAFGAVMTAQVGDSLYQRLHIFDLQSTVFYHAVAHNEDWDGCAVMGVHRKSGC